MTQNVQISKRLDDGTILVLGAVDWDEFDLIATDAVGKEDAADIKRLFKQLVPVYVPAPPYRSQTPRPSYS